MHKLERLLLSLEKGEAKFLVLFYYCIMKCQVEIIETNAIKLLAHASNDRSHRIYSTYYVQLISELKS